VRLWQKRRKIIDYAREKKIPTSSSSQGNGKVSKGGGIMYTTFGKEFESKKIRPRLHNNKGGREIRGLEKKEYLLIRGEPFREKRLVYSSLKKERSYSMRGEASLSQRKRKSDTFIWEKMFGRGREEAE